MNFTFKGTIPSSKSLYNRALITQSFYPQLKVIGISESEDIDLLKKSIEGLLLGKARFYVGEAGTGLRFLLARLSRFSGQFEIHAHPRLLTRPHQELLDILKQLGQSEFKYTKHSIKVTSQGWRKPNQDLVLSLKTSSQYLSGILLSAWDLPFDLILNVINSSLSQKVDNSYSGMTLSFLRSAGMQVDVEQNQIIVPSSQKCSLMNYQVEPDWSSAAAILMATQIDGSAEIENCSGQSLQPDSIIVTYLNRMNANCYFQSNRIFGHKSTLLTEFQGNFEACPDLVPCFAILCAFAKGHSRLTGLSKLAFKESNRLQNTIHLLGLAGISTHYQEDQLVIEGKGPSYFPKSFTYDPDQDHRMAMAAGLLKLRNPKIQVLHPNVVNKSFKNFWKILGFTL